MHDLIISFQLSECVCERDCAVCVSVCNCVSMCIKLLPTCSAVYGFTLLRRLNEFIG